MIRRGFFFGGWLSLGVLVLLLGGCNSQNGPGTSARTSLDVSLQCGEEARPSARDPKEIPIEISETYDGEGPYKIVCTIGMVSDIVRKVAGNRAEVEGLMKEGVDPHLYQATRDDVLKMQNADVIFYSGLRLENKSMQNHFSQQAAEGKPVFAVTDAVSRDYLHSPPEYEGHYDPHIWGDVAAWSLCVDYVARALSVYDPDGRAIYAANAEAYREQLKELAEYVDKVIGSIPEDQRVLVTAHDAFGYFSCAYEIPVKSAQGISTESEAGVQDVNQLVELIVTRKIPAIFVESSVNQKNMLAVIEGARDRGQDVQIGGELFSDAMGPAGTYEGTYLGMIDHNATTIARALGGDAPERGFQGKLKSD